MFRTIFIALLMTGATISASADGRLPAMLASAPVRLSGARSFYAAEAVVEAVRQTVVSAQVQGAIVQLAVKAGDYVHAGQLLVRIDARAAEQSAAASNAQVDAARAELEVTKRDLSRQKQLFDQRYISQAALDRAAAQFKTTQAQTDAQLAQAGVARTQSGFYTIVAPYSGLITDVPVTQGDMAMPGRPLLTVYDPAHLRVTASVPHAIVAKLAPNQPVKIEFPGLSAAQRWQMALRMVVLPMADASTHTVQVRLDLPGDLASMTPGMFARVLLPLMTNDDRRLFVPSNAIVRRAELTAVYVLNDQGKPLLRQVKLGSPAGDEVEVLSGLTAGERVALDPLVAARVR
jgi:RND family efflux transporter MFP subunit